MQRTHDPYLKRALADQVCLRIYQHLRAVEGRGTLAEGSEQGTEFLEAAKGSGEEARGLFHQQVCGMVVEREEGLFGLRRLFRCSRGLSSRGVLQEAVEGEELCSPSTLLLWARRGQCHWPSPRLVFV